MEGGSKSSRYLVEERSTPFEITNDGNVNLVPLKGRRDSTMLNLGLKISGISPLTIRACLLSSPFKTRAIYPSKSIFDCINKNGVPFSHFEYKK